MSKQECPRCLARGKDWTGGDPKCAFLSGVFDTDNWNCATANCLRELADAFWTNGDGSDKVWTHRSFSAGSMGVVQIPETGPTAIGYVVMTWYKDRGRTGQMWVMYDDDPPRPLTLSEAEEILEAYAELETGVTNVSE